MRLRWSFSAAALLALLALLPPARAQAAPADTVGLPFVHSIHTIPVQPCPDVPTRIVLKGSFPTVCGALLGHQGFTLRVSDPYPTCVGCPMDSIAWSDTLDVGLLAAGTHLVQLAMTVVDTCPGIPDTTYTEPFEFTVFAGCEPSPGSLVQSIQVTAPDRLQPCPTDSVLVTIDGIFPNDCYRLRAIQLLPPLAPFGPAPLVRVVIDDGCCLLRPCVQEPVPWHGRVMLPPMPEGHHVLPVEVGVTCCADTFDSATPRELIPVVFGVLGADSCRAPSPPNPLRYIDQVRVTSLADSTARPCAGDSIRVTITGTFPDNCIVLRRIEPLITDTMGPPRPGFRLVFDSMCCLGMVCGPPARPWRVELVMGPLWATDYGLRIAAVEVCCSDSIRPEDPRGFAVFPFTVLSPESCRVAPNACLWPGWEHPGGAGGCDAYFDVEGRASIVSQVRTTVPLAGFQGAFRALSESGEPAHVAVASIEPIGPAAGMRLTWQREPSGARFVLFADQGAPIPATGFDGPAASVLRITWGPAPVIPEDPPEPIRRAYVSWGPVLGSDEHGGAVPLCPFRDPARLPDVAILCAASGRCDLNGDALSDVRDLVLMAHCLLQIGPCPPDPATSLDCQGDQDFDLDDVICCAQAVLGTPPCPGCADSVRAEPSIGLSFGAPVRTATGYDIPVRIAGADRIGAARIAFRMPEALAAAASLSLPGNAYLPIEQHQPGRLVWGLVSLQPPGILPAGPGPYLLEATLRIAHAGAEGRIVAEEAELSGPDGVRLAVDLGEPAVRLGAGVTVALSPARPNPFRTGTTFRLTLDAEADVDVGVYDLAGRRVATVVRGRLPVGVHPFTWDGRGDHGRVPAGVYFVRAGAPGTALVQKLVLVRE